MTAPSLDLLLTTEPAHSVATVATVVLVSNDPAVISVGRAAQRRHRDTTTVLQADSEERLTEILSTLERVDMLIVQAVTSGGVADAETLLDRFRRESPDTARVVLIDPTDSSAMARFAPIAHQVVPRPIGVELLSGLVERVHRSSGLALCEPVRSLVGQTDRLPSPPDTLVRINKILESDGWRLEDLVHEISQDAASTSEIFRLVNSSFYGAAARVTSIERAISMIGTNLTCSILLGNSMFQSSGGFDTWLDLDRLALRSKSVALGARALAIREAGSSDIAASAYLTGLVSEIGLLVLARVPDISPTVAAPINSSTFHIAERMLFGGDRFEVGGHLLSLWGFDDEVIESIRRLASGERSAPGIVGWCVASARRLVIDRGFDPLALEAPAGTDVEIDQAIASLRTSPFRGAFGVDLTGLADPA